MFVFAQQCRFVINKRLSPESIMLASIHVKISLQYLKILYILLVKKATIAAIVISISMYFYIPSCDVLSENTLFSIN